MQSVLNDNPCFGPPVSFSAASLLDTPDILEAYSEQTTYAAMKPYLKDGATVLDLGCGMAEDLAIAIAKDGCHYIGVDKDMYSLSEMHYAFQDQGLDCLLEQRDITYGLSDYADDSFDVVLLKSVLVHLPTDVRQAVIREMHRIASKAVFIAEASWSRIGNATHGHLFDNYRRASARLLQYHDNELRLDSKLPGLLSNALPRTPWEYFRIDDQPDGDYSPQFLENCQSAQICLIRCYEGRDKHSIGRAIYELSDYLESGNAVFTPQACVIAHIPKTTRS